MSGSGGGRAGDLPSAQDRERTRLGESCAFGARPLAAARRRPSAPLVHSFVCWSG